jgi:hypothetical protein
VLNFSIRMHNLPYLQGLCPSAHSPQSYFWQSVISGGVDLVTHATCVPCPASSSCKVKFCKNNFRLAQSRYKGSITFVGFLPWGYIQKLEIENVPRPFVAHRARPPKSLCISEDYIAYMLTWFMLIPEGRWWTPVFNQWISPESRIRIPLTIYGAIFLPMRRLT